MISLREIIIRILKEMAVKLWIGQNVNHGSRIARLDQRPGADAVDVQGLLLINAHRDVDTKALICLAAELIT
jgi:hypothetical protein